MNTIVACHSNHIFERCENRCRTRHGEEYHRLCGFNLLKQFFFQHLEFSPEWSTKIGQQVVLFDFILFWCLNVWSAPIERRGVIQIVIRPRQAASVVKRSNLLPPPAAGRMQSWWMAVSAVSMDWSIDDPMTDCHSYGCLENVLKNFVLNSVLYWSNKGIGADMVG